jgi:hypothetical protein
MATLIDFTKQGNQVQVTTTVDGTAGAIQCYVGYPVKYSFNAAGTTINVLFGGAGSYSCALADLRVAGSGTAPASVAAALTALSAVFGLYP